MGGCTASHNKGGPYFRRRAVPTDPQSSFQSVVRQAFGDLSQEFVNNLTAGERAGWDTYAQNVSWTDVLGQSIQLSGINHFIRSNTPRLQNEFYRDAGLTGFEQTTAVVEAAPTTYDLGQTPVLGQATCTVGAGPVVTLTLPNLTPVPVTTDAGMIVVGPPQNASISFFKGPYLLVASAVGDDSAWTVVLSSAAANPYASRYALPVVGQRIFGQVRFSKADGRLSVATPFTCLVTAAA